MVDRGGGGAKDRQQGAERLRDERGLEEASGRAVPRPGWPASTPAGAADAEGAEHVPAGGDGQQQHRQPDRGDQQQRRPAVAPPPVVLPGRQLAPQWRKPAVSPPSHSWDCTPISGAAAPLLLLPAQRGVVEGLDLVDQLLDPAAKRLLLEQGVIMQLLEVDQ